MHSLHCETVFLPHSIRSYYFYLIALMLIPVGSCWILYVPTFNFVSVDAKTFCLYCSVCVDDRAVRDSAEQAPR